jgi:hypothetical protein
MVSLYHSSIYWASAVTTSTKELELVAAERLCPRRLALDFVLFLGELVVLERRPRDLTVDLAHCKILRKGFSFSG